MLLIQKRGTAFGDRDKPGRLALRGIAEPPVRRHAHDRLARRMPRRLDRRRWALVLLKRDLIDGTEQHVTLAELPYDGRPSVQD